MLEKIFHLRENSTSVRVETLAGLTTFLAMAYIIFVQPMILSAGGATGMDAAALVTTTCLAAAFGSLLMGLLANYPVALAPGMGCNIFFATTLILQNNTDWQTALGVIFFAGILFLLLTLIGVRKLILTAVSSSLRNAIGVGIGLFIALLGLKNSTLIVDGHGLQMGLTSHPLNPDVVVFFAGLFVGTALLTRGWRGAVFFSILGSLAMAILLKVCAPTDSSWLAGSALAGSFTLPTAIVGCPASPGPVVMQMDLVGALSLQMLPFIFVFLFMDIFDTMGTLVGVTSQAGMVDAKGNVPGLHRAFLADSVATIGGACVGQPIVTSYVESIAGVEVGGRTGLMSVVVAIFFLLATFFTPLVLAVGSYAALTAPVLVLVGLMMLRGVTRLDWEDPSELLPCFMVVLGIPLCGSISDGIALGLLTYPPVKLLAGKARQAGWLSWVLCGLVVLYFLFLR